jgi:hypothetical protein
LAAGVSLLAGSAAACSSPGAAYSPRPKASVTPALDVALKDQSFVYRTGDHLTGSDYQPTTNVYGDVDGRPLYLVGDSMAAQLATPALAVAKKRGLALKPRSKATVSFVLPAEGPPDERRWREEVLEQIVADKEERPIVLLTGQGMDHTGEVIRTVARLREQADADVRLVTVTPAPKEDVLSEVVEHGTGFRWTRKHWGRSRDAMLAAARSSRPRVPLLDLKPIVARDGRDGTYPAVVDGTLIFGPGTHLTDTFATRYLEAPIDDLLD